MSSLDILKFFIEQKRIVMVQSADRYGINSEITIKHSKELDKLLNDYLDISRGKSDEQVPSHHHYF